MVIKLISLTGLTLTAIGASTEKKWLANLGFGISMVAIGLAFIRLLAYLLG